MFCMQKDKDAHRSAECSGIFDMDYSHFTSSCFRQKHSGFIELSQLTLLAFLSTPAKKHSATVIQEILLSPPVPYQGEAAWLLKYFWGGGEFEKKKKHFS